MRLSLPAGQDRDMGGSKSHTTPGGRGGRLEGEKSKGSATGSCRARWGRVARRRSERSNIQAALPRAAAWPMAAVPRGRVLASPRDAHLWGGTMSPTEPCPKGSLCIGGHRDPCSSCSSQSKGSRRCHFGMCCWGTRALRWLRGLRRGKGRCVAWPARRVPTSCGAMHEPTVKTPAAAVLRHGWARPPPTASPVEVVWGGGIA